MNLRLRQIRKQKKMRQEDLAAVIDSTPRIVGAWERGETLLPLEDAALIADVLECSLDELAGRDWTPSVYSDPRQARLNEAYESLNEEGKEKLADDADTMCASGKFGWKSGEDGLAQKTAG